jgi:hypothetical protein
MGSVDNGAQRASGRKEPVHSSITNPPPPRPRGGQRWPVLLLLLGALAAGSIGPSTSSTEAGSSYILMPRSELLALPTSGPGWDLLKSVADAPLPAPNLCDINGKANLATFASALVFARTGVAAYGAKARAGVMAALPTQVVGCSGGVLSLGRQLTAYVLAANLAGLSGTDDATFRTWLTTIRSKNIGGHSVWYTLIGTQQNASNNWGAYAGASRIAADLYLGDLADLALAAKITRGFLGDRAAYAGFKQNLDADDLSWTCSGSGATYTPVNPACVKQQINLDGGIPNDISRGGGLRWPPAEPGISYQVDSIQGMGLQVELLYRNGYPDAWSWSNAALKRAADIVTRSGTSGGATWNMTTSGRQMPWLLNRRYGTKIPTAPAGIGRGIGFTEWLYGTAPASTGGTVTTATAPQVAAPTVVLGRVTVPTTGVPALVRWSLASSSTAVSRYDLQVSRNGAAYTGLSLASPTAASQWVVLGAGSTYRYRVRAVDTAGRIGDWRTVGPVRGGIVGDTSSAIAYAGSWGSASYPSYLGGTVHYTRQAGATATLRFSGQSVAIVGPVGPGRGKFTVTVDGRAIATVDQVASTFAARRLLFAYNTAAGTHTIVIRALGTTGRPMVAFDALEIVAPS